jgi:hypothetical protein
MISALVAAMKTAIFFPLLVSVLILGLPSAVIGGNPPAGNAPFSANDLDWREMVPYLYKAATQPGEQGLETMLENSKIIRVYIGREIRRECRPGNDRCDSSRPGFSFDSEVNKRIDGIVREGMLHQHKNLFVNYSLGDAPFPFSAVAVLKSDNHQDAYFVLEFAPHAYTGQDVQSKYGAPYDTDVFDRYGVFKYKLNDPNYTSKTVFEINPIDDQVMKIAISVKAKKHR